MYVAAALCMLFIRAWKIGQVEAIAAEEQKDQEESAPKAVDATKVERTLPSASNKQKLNYLRRAMKWKKV